MSQLLDSNAPITLRELVKLQLHAYLQHLDGASPRNLHDLVFKEVEMSLIEFVLDYVAGNQSKAAELLGLSRGTLRRKLAEYSIKVGVKENE